MLTFFCLYEAECAVLKFHSPFKKGKGNIESKAQRTGVAERIGFYEHLGNGPYHWKDAGNNRSGQLEPTNYLVVLILQVVNKKKIYLYVDMSSLSVLYFTVLYCTVLTDS